MRYNQPEMKQVLQNIRSGETIIAEVPVPTPQRGEVLVQTATSLLSAGTERMVVEFAGKSLLGKARSRPDLVRQVIEKTRREGLLTTLDSVLNRLDQPMALGYSSAGTIVALGEGVQGFHVGQRVACAGGGYAVHAEFVCVPRILLAPLPDHVDFEQAAFATLGAIALHGFRLAGTQLGENVAVIGLGLLGLLAVSIAKAAGCRVLGIELDPSRVELAHQMGIQAYSRDQAVEAAQSFSGGAGCDAVLICADTSSADPVELAGLIARDRAKVIAIGAVGLQLPRKIYYEKELLFLNSRSYGPGRYDPGYEESGHDYPAGYVRWTEGRNLAAVIDLVADGKLAMKPLISHRFPIDHADEAYQIILGKTQEPFLGVLLTYPDALQLDEIKSDGQHWSQTAPEYKAAPADHLALGVLGAGNFATAVMLPALKKTPGVELVGIASASGVNAQSAASRFGFQYAVSHEQQILDDPRINTVAILTRHNLHARQVITALQAGKHVFCEKPLALTENELLHIQEALEAVNGKQLLMVGFNRRFAPFAQKLHQFLLNRQEPMIVHYRVNAGYLPLNHWTQDLEQGGGRIIGEACHFIDLITFLVGDPPLAVSTSGLPDAQRYREDNVLITLQFPDGSIGTVSYLANGDKAYPKERVEVFSGGRVGVLDDFRMLETVRDGQRHVEKSRLRQDKGHAAEWQAFSTSIINGLPAPIPYDHLVGVTRASFAAVSALRSGGRIDLR